MAKHGEKPARKIRTSLEGQSINLRLGKIK